MDPELYALFQQLAASTRGKSTALNMLDNPIALALAGVWDPAVGYETAEPEMGPVTRTFSSSESPLMQEVLGYVQSGVDPYWLRSFITNKVEPNEISDLGYTVDDFTNAAVALQREFQDSQEARRRAVADDPFVKAGLRNPMDVYTTQDVPIPENMRSQMEELLAKRVAASQRMEQADTDTRQAQARLKELTGDDAKSLDDMAEYLRSKGVNVSKADVAAARAQDVAGRVPQAVSETRRVTDMLSMITPSGMTGRASKAARNVVGDVVGSIPGADTAGDIIGGAKDVVGKFATVTNPGRLATRFIGGLFDRGKDKAKDLLPDSIPKSNNIKEMYARILREEQGPAVRAQMQQAAAGATAREEASRENRLASMQDFIQREALRRVYAKQGRTPFRDQAAILMQFLGSK